MLELPKIIRTKSGYISRQQIPDTPEALVESLLAVAGSPTTAWHIRKLMTESLDEWLAGGSESYRRIRSGILTAAGLGSLLLGTSSLPSRDFVGEQAKPCDKRWNVITSARAAFDIDGSATLWNLFGVVLPCRRAEDLALLQITDESILGGNYYSRRDDTLTFSKYKTSAKFGVQTFSLSELVPIAGQRAVDAARDFLNRQPDGFLFPAAARGAFTVYQTRNSGFVSNDARRFWTNMIQSSGVNAVTRLLAFWHAHSEGTAVRVYGEQPP